MCVKRKRRRGRLGGHGTKNPTYEEVNIPKPPPIPNQFPSLSGSDVKPYTSAVNGTGTMQKYSDMSDRFKPPEFKMSQNKVYELQDQESCYYEDLDSVTPQQQESSFAVAKLQQEQGQVLQSEDTPRSPLHKNEKVTYGFTQANETTAVEDPRYNTVHGEEVSQVCKDSVNKTAREQDMDYVKMASAPAQLTTTSS